MTPTQTAYRVGRTIGRLLGYAEGYFAAESLWRAKLAAREAAHHAQMARSRTLTLAPFAPERTHPGEPRPGDYTGGPVTWD